MRKLLKTMVFTQETRGRWIEGGALPYIYIYIYLTNVRDAIS